VSGSFGVIVMIIVLVLILGVCVYKCKKGKKQQAGPTQDIPNPLYVNSRTFHVKMYLL
jgi:hypothetical protein